MFVSELEDGFGNGCTVRAAVLTPTSELAAAISSSADDVDVASLASEGVAPMAVYLDTEAICPGRMEGIAVNDTIMYVRLIEDCLGLWNTDEVGSRATVLNVGSSDPGPLPMAGTEPFCFPGTLVVGRVMVMGVEGVIGSVVNLLAETISKEG